MPKRVHSAGDRDDDTELTSNQSAPKRTRKTNEDREINDLCQKLYDGLRAFKSEDGRIVCENFIRLPSKRTHADYYTLIKQPIDLIRIQQKIRTDEYQTFESFIDDIQLLLTNAKTFYRKNSNEWRDASDLSKYFDSKINTEHSNRKRILKKNNEIDNEESIEKKRRPNRSSTEMLTNGTSIKIELHDNPSIDPYYFEEFFTAIYNANINERAMSEIFLFLPSRKLYPDYYLIVTNPIDLKLIAMKIQNNQYLTLDDMENDLLLMISNAKKYNDPKSQIYKDACALRKMIITVRNELESALKTTKNDRLRPRKRDVLLSSEIATTDYPEEPDDEDVIRIKQTDDGADSDTSSLDGEEQDSFRILYNAVKTYKLGAQSLIDPFMKLPKKRFHQDYYEEIKRPIAMSSIKNHIKKGQYTDLADLVDDLKLVFNNAMQYNQEGSLIYNSAKKLMDVALVKAHELGYDEHKPRLKEPRINTSTISIKEEYLESSPNPQLQPRNRSSPSESPALQSPNTLRGRPSKKLLKYTEQNIHTLYTYIQEYQENDIDLITPFSQLPSASEYPDYYESIEQPIDMSIIKDKIDKGLYKREQDIVDDFIRMFNNAKIYNVDESYIFKNACRLERVLADKYKVLIKKKEKLIQNLNSNRPTNQGLTKKSSIKTLNHLIQTIKTYSDQHGRVLSTVFLTLPSKIDYPDYYEIIQRPIDLKRIESRQYSSINELSNDLQLMFDNACLYNEPGSTIYRDALSLQNVFIDQRKTFLNTQFNIQNLVQDLIWDLFIQTFNAEDSQGRFYTDSFTDLPEQADNEPFDIVYTFDLIRQNLNQRRYHRLDVVQDDLFRVFERARKLSSIESQIYQDTIQLQRFYIRLRDEICAHGSVLRSSALLFNENRLQQELARERIEKEALVNINNQNSISTNKSLDDDVEKKDFSTKSSTENSSISKGETFYIGDFVYIEPHDDTSEPNIICIESFEHKDNEDYFNGLQFYRPNETYHLPTKKFLRQELFLTQTIEHIPMNKIQGLCHVLHMKDYFKYQPIIENQINSSLKFQDLDKDIYVCESRYNIKTKIVKKIKWWNLPENKRVKLIPRDTILEPIREQLTIVNNNLLHRQSISDNELNNVDIIDKIKETVPYDSVINEKLNENLPEKKQYYEQIVISSNCFYKVGDYVYIQGNTNMNNQLDKSSILRIDKIWKDDDSYSISGPFFIRPCDITNRDQLIITTKSSYEREVFKCDGSNKQIFMENIKGKCSVLPLKHYRTCRLTEIPENDVYVCESKYIIDDHSLRSLTKVLKRTSLSLKAFADEIWTFRKELLLRQDTPGGPFKLVDDGSFMDVDDQTNSNHASNVDGDDHQSNHLNSDTANSSNNINITTTNNNNLNSSSTPNRTNNSRKPSRRGSSARAPCGYLVFASESRKRLIKDNPGIPFGEMSRMIGDQWRRLTASERDKYEEKARERAREQEVGSAQSTQVTNNNPTANYESHNMPVINPQRIVNGGVTINGHYQTAPNMSNVHQMNGNIQTIQKPPAAAIVTCPPRTQRLVHSEAYLRYIENLKPDNQFISDWPKQLKASMNNTTNSNNGNNSSRTLPSNWFLNGSPGLYNNVHEALWSMRDNMWSDVIRIRNVLSDEW